MKKVWIKLRKDYIKKFFGYKEGWYECECRVHPSGEKQAWRKGWKEKESAETFFTIPSAQVSAYVFSDPTKHDLQKLTKELEEVTKELNDQDPYLKVGFLRNTGIQPFADNVGVEFVLKNDLKDPLSYQVSPVVVT